MAKIAIIGYGKMGKEIEKKIFAMQHTISVIVDTEDDWAHKEHLLASSDAAIEFSTPETAYHNCKRCLECRVPLVTGTTGWQEQMSLLISEYEGKEISFLSGSNFSIGANIFFKINEELAKLMNGQMQYEVALEEIHHIAKKDKPSGTAITLADTIIKQLSRKKKWGLGEATICDTIGIDARRENNVTGIHQVDYTSKEDTISIRHTAHNREGFAIGAVKAALWLIEHPGIYRFQDIFLNI